MESKIRKDRSEQILKEQNIPVNPNLPGIKSKDEVVLRTKEETVDRALCLAAVSLKQDGLEQADIEEFIKDHDITDKFSPSEIEFIKTESVSLQGKIQFTWRYESLWVLLWALGYLKALKYPGKLCNPAIAIQIISSKTLEEFQKYAKLRDISEILDQADLIYRYHWAVLDARIKNLPIPGKLDAGVVQERHYALNWLINYRNQGWDNVTTDI
ncbi:DUF4272 domain-containing protein [Patescibacteria group bacterium]|nr:DUF4272 domain-containing protein [Patescibacteria group bacterium]